MWFKNINASSQFLALPVGLAEIETTSVQKKTI